MVSSSCARYQIPCLQELSLERMSSDVAQFRCIIVAKLRSPLNPPVFSLEFRILCFSLQNSENQKPQYGIQHVHLQTSFSLQNEIIRTEISQIKPLVATKIISRLLYLCPTVFRSRTNDNWDEQLPDWVLEQNVFGSPE
jgi:hypothetical protein